MITTKKIADSGTIAISLIVFIFLFSLQSPGQSDCAIRGNVFVNNSPIEFVNVVLTSVGDTNKVVKAGITDSTGHFELAGLRAGDYFLNLKMIGYIPFRINLSSDTINKKTDLRNIQLTPDSKLLEAVDIISHKDLIKKTPQGFIINAKDNLTQAGGTATDILKNTPTVVVDPDGGITIRGKSPLILINGRNSSLAATDRIPASSIESIEIINNPSAQYDADAEGGIINIKLKKNVAKGTNGSVALGAGYGAKGRINSSFIINHTSAKWNLGLAYDNRFAGRTRKISGSRTNFDLPAEFYLTQDRFDKRLEQTQNLKFNIDFNPNNKNSFSFEAIGNMDGQDNDETLASMFETRSDSFNNKNSRRSIEIGREKVAEFALGYSRKFNDSRKHLSANISSSFNLETENTDITTRSLDVNDANLGNPFLQRTHNYQNSNVSNFKIDYVHPISKKALLETGYKGITRFMNADFQSLSYLNSEYTVNPLASNIFDFTEQIHAAYLQYRSYVGKTDSAAKWKYDIGLRAEEVLNHGKGVTNNINVKRQYFNLFPTANLIYYFSLTDFFKLSLSRRINRPGLGDLNPFTDITDSLNQHSGNPYLKPELVNSGEIGYNKEWNKISLSSNLFYRYATNIIRSYIFLKNDGVAITRPMNYGNATTYGFEGIASFYPSKFWNANTSFSLYQQNINGNNVSAGIVSNVFSWYGKIINNFNLWKGCKLQVIASYNSPIATPQGQKVAIYFADMGFQQKIMKGKGGLGIVVTDIFNTQANGYSARGSDFTYNKKSKIDTRAVIVTFAYSFGTVFKEALIENKFSND